jgi:para-nitrobenzyl esterase
LRYVVGVLPGLPSEQEATISREMRTYWTNFAKTGNPNGGGLPVWPRFDPKTRRYIEFTDNGTVAKAHLRREACVMFAEELKRRMAR